MCRSPDELTNVELVRLINVLTDWLKSPQLSPDARRVYEGRIKGYQEMLKEREGAML